jgi:polar amino acid transport system ATP-binding protein
MIRIRDLHKRFGSHEVLSGVSLSVDAGEVVCLIGPSGSGKSTVLRCINGLESYEAGEITVFGERVDREDRGIHQLRRRMGMVFQRFNLFPHRTVLANVMEGPVYVKREPPNRCAQKPWRCWPRLGCRTRQMPGRRKLSGGQQQRVAIARALAMEPDGRCCSTSRRRRWTPRLVGEVLGGDGARWPSEGMTMIVVTHEMGFATEGRRPGVLFMSGGQHRRGGAGRGTARGADPGPHPGLSAACAAPGLTTMSTTWPPSLWAATAPAAPTRRRWPNRSLRCPGRRGRLYRPVDRIASGRGWRKGLCAGCTGTRLGASGRNGGQVNPTLKHDPEDLLRIYGPEAGERLIAGGQ